MPSFSPNIIRVLNNSSWMSADWYGARSICEYCLVPASSAEMRLLASAIRFTDNSVSIVYFSHPMALCSVAEQSASHSEASTRSSQSVSRPASTKVGA